MKEKKLYRTKNDIQLELDQATSDLSNLNTAFRTQEDFCKNLFEHLGDEVHHWKLIRDKKGNIITWILIDANDHALHSWGKKRNEVVGKTTNEIFGYDATSQFMPFVQEIFKTGKPKKWIEFFEPSQQYLQMKTIPYGHDYFISIGNDVTEQKMAELDLTFINKNLGKLVEERAKKEKQLSKELELYWLAADHAKSGVWRYDIKTRKLEWDDIMYRLYEINKDDYASPNEAWDKCLHKKDKIPTLRELNNAIQKQKPFDTIFRVTHPKTGKVLYIRGKGKVEFNALKQPIAIFGTNWDITKEMKLVEEKEKARKAEEIYRLAAENAKAGVWLFQTQEQGAIWDKMCYKMYEVKKKDYPNLVPYEVWVNSLHPEDRERVVNSLNEAVQQTTLWSVNFRIITNKTKTIKYIKTTGKVQVDENDEISGVYGFNWDISKEMALVEKLQYTVEELKEAQSQLIQSEKMASLGVLTAGVAHEINNPLNYIQGGSNAIQKYLIENKEIQKEKIAEFLEWINTGAERATRIVKSLNKYSTNRVIHKEECELHQIIEDCLLFVHNRFQDRIEITKSFCQSELIIDGNDAELRQSFLNIIVNAIDAIEDRGNIVITTKELTKEVELIIKDDGCGIAKENLTKVTDPFFTTKPAGEGVGLGLSITNSIIKEHKGSLQITSTLGKGTTITIRLPRAKIK